MGLFVPERLVLEVKVAGQWGYLNSRPDRPRDLTFTRDRRIALDLMTPVFARLVVQGYDERCPDAPVEEWRVRAELYGKERIVLTGE